MNRVCDTKSMKDKSDEMGKSKPSSLRTIRNSLIPNLSADKLAIDEGFYIKISINVYL